VADIRPVEAEFAGKILTKGRVATNYSIRAVLPICHLAGIGMIACVFPTVFPNDGARSLLELPVSEARLVFAIGAAIFVVTAFCGLLFPKLLSGSYLYFTVKRQIARRQSAIVRPGGGSVYVDIIPRENWNRLMWENAADIGFLRVDTARREILFEGDNQRCRIPAVAVLSCELEKSLYTAAARPDSPGLWVVVIRASTPDGVWEAPVMPRLFKRRVTPKRRLQVAQDLRKAIQAILPVINQPHNQL
jgi:hypothetical protein